jgi:hypothetical protein
LGNGLVNAKVEIFGGPHEFRIVEQLHEIVREDIPVVGTISGLIGYILIQFLEVLVILHELVGAIKARETTFSISELWTRWVGSHKEDGIGGDFTGITVHLAEHDTVTRDKVLQNPIVVLSHALKFLDLDDAAKILKKIPNYLPFSYNGGHHPQAVEIGIRVRGVCFTEHLLKNVLEEFRLSTSIGTNEDQPKFQRPHVIVTSSL